MFFDIASHTSVITTETVNNNSKTIGSHTNRGVFQIRQSNGNLFLSIQSSVIRGLRFGEIYDLFSATRV